MDIIDHAAQIVRSYDRDRYLADLLAPAAARRHLLVLHAFNVEIARVRDLVSEPNLGEIRLQFWRDAVRGDDAGHPVAQALVETIATFNLPIHAFDDLIEARRFDLYNDPMPSLNDLEGYAGDTSSSLFQLATIVLANGGNPGAAEIAGHGGVAYALAGLIRALPIHSARGQCYLPADLLAAHDTDRQAVLSGTASPGLTAVLNKLKALARDHADKVRGKIGELDPAIFPAFLPVALISPQLEIMDRKGHDPFRSSTDLTPLRRQWILWRSAKRGSISPIRRPA